MKVALVHDYIKEYGGAERVLEALHETFPQAPVYTSVYLPQFLGPHRERFRGWNIKTSFAQHLPFKAKLISPLRILSPLLFKSFDLSKFDIVIVSATGAYIPNSIRCHPEGSLPGGGRPKDLDSSPSAQNDNRRPLHVCYCHTPPRYLYGYMTARDWKKNVVFRVLGEIANHFLRLIDFKAAQNVDYFIANSEEVASRIKKFYRRNSTVIYPPVNIEKSKTQIKNKKEFEIGNLKLGIGNYYLTGGRLARAKGIDIIIDTFVKSKKPLKIFGKGFGGWEKNVKCQIEYVGEVTDEEKFELMTNAKAFIFSSFDEDFGITPVEAMACGTPVIAYKSGGVKETVIDGKTGIFYSENTKEGLTQAIERFEKIKIDQKDCLDQARKFSKERFIKEIKDYSIKKVKNDC